MPSQEKVLTGIETEDVRYKELARKTQEFARVVNRLRSRTANDFVGLVEEIKKQVTPAEILVLLAFNSVLLESTKLEEPADR